MAMRPVESNWYRDFMYNLKNTKTRFDTAISQSTSGKKLNHLSDSPADMSYVLTMRSKIDQIDQFDRNINSAYKYLNTAETALSQTQNLLYSVVSLVDQGASENTGAEGRALIADRIDAIREEMMNFANSEVMGKYVFSGSATDTTPFIVNAGAIQYEGNDDTVSTQADFSVTVAMNIPGSDVFGQGASVPGPAGTPPYDIFHRLNQISDALRADDTDALGTYAGEMNEYVGQISEAIGTIGGRTAHLQQIQGMLKSFKTSLTAKMSSLEDADMAEAISNLGREEVGLQAILQAGSRINRVSLMNFLG